MKMKNIILTILFLFPSLMFGQTYKFYQTENYHNQLRLNSATGEVLQVQDDGQSWVLCYDIVSEGGKSGRFSLYATQNMWTYILLDTYTGRTWQVQYSVKGEEYQFTIPINAYSYLTFDEYYNNDCDMSNRFQLFETQNMWTFILLDSFDGRLWQLQYSVDSDDDYRFCIPINTVKLVDNSRRSIFYIQPLVSMFQYYLINDANGSMWKFQWSTKGDDYRWIEAL
jgi:hypothetical protein